MGQPKAKWEFDPGAGWSADCGPFHLHANNAGDGRAELYDSEWKGLWEHKLAAPYDIVDLMLLAEVELERRLRVAAETMRGEELVAEHVPGADCSACETCGAHCQPIGSIVDGRCDSCRRDGRLLTPGELSDAVDARPTQSNAGKHYSELRTYFVAKRWTARRVVD